MMAGRPRGGRGRAAWSSHVATLPPAAARGRGHDGG
jgi:hypothetical protein